MASSIDRSERSRVLAAIHANPFLPLVFYSVVSSVVFWLMGWPILILLLPFLVAYVWWFIGYRNKPIIPTTGFLSIYIAMYVIQIFHLVEEWNTGFYQAFPALWGHFWFGDPGRFPAWPQLIFISGNLMMDAFWEIAILLFPARNRWANYTVWLFMSGMVVNAVGHSCYSLWLFTHPSLQHYLATTYGLHYTWYFPGLFTSFLHAVVVVMMIRQLRRNYSSTPPATMPSLGESLGRGMTVSRAP